YYLSYACFYPNQTLRQVYSGYLNGAIGQIDDYSRIAWKKELVARKNLKYDVTIESREEWENPLKVSYIWNGENELTIDLALVTSRSYTFRSKNGGIEVVFWACRDC
ncbi:MAG: hypothetical protein LBO72_02345, partial [Helicobacteraceae bacterium]|nr:hypothetical protein [Helicobacteraceae bacterium]